MKRPFCASAARLRSVGCAPRRRRRGLLVCASMYVCMSISIYIYTSVSAWACTCTCTYTHTSLPTSVGMHASLGVGMGKKKGDNGGGVFMQSAFSPSSQPCGGRDPARRFRQASDDERERVSVSVSVSIWLRGGPVSRSPHSCRPLHTHHLLSLNLSALGPCTRPLQRCIGSDPCCRSAGS